MLALGLLELLWLMHGLAAPSQVNSVWSCQHNSGEILHLDAFANVILERSC
jgi:hypothetical protein